MAPHFISVVTLLSLRWVLQNLSIFSSSRYHNDIVWSKEKNKASGLLFWWSKCVWGNIPRAVTSLQHRSRMTWCQLWMRWRWFTLCTISFPTWHGEAVLYFFIFRVLIQNLQFQGIILMWNAYSCPVSALFAGSLVWDILFVSLLFGNAVLESNLPDQREAC